jgi:hypothetical protein
MGGFDSLRLHRGEKETKNVNIDQVKSQLKQDIEAAIQRATAAMTTEVMASLRTSPFASEPLPSLLPRAEEVPSTSVAIVPARSVPADIASKVLSVLETSGAQLKSEAIRDGLKSAFGLDVSADALRPVLKSLVTGKQVKVRGERRSTTYQAV